MMFEIINGDRYFECTYIYNIEILFVQMRFIYRTIITNCGTIFTKSKREM